MYEEIQINIKILSEKETIFLSRGSQNRQISFSLNVRLSEKIIVTGRRKCVYVCVSVFR